VVYVCRVLSAMVRAEASRPVWGQPELPPALWKPTYLSFADQQ
jgi:hypothetical protein